MPLVRDLNTGLVVFFIASLPHGFLNVVMQALLIQMWGVGNSKWLVCAYHFLASFGQMLGPSFALLFLRKNEEDYEVEGRGENTSENLVLKLCTNVDRQVYEPEINSTALNANSTIGIDYVDSSDIISGIIQPVFWPWFFFGSAYCFYGVLGIFTGIMKFRKQIEKSNDIQEQIDISVSLLQETKIYETRVTNSETETSKTNPKKKSSLFKRDIWFLVGVFTVMIFHCMMERSFTDFGFTYSICIKHFTKSQASFIMSCMFSGIVTGRFLSIFLINLIKPRNFVIFSVFGQILGWAALLVEIDGSKVDDQFFVLAFLAFCMGCTGGPVYATIVSWSTEFIDVTKGYSMVYGMGCFSGQFISTVFGFLHMVDDLMWKMCNVGLGLVSLGGCFYLMVLQKKMPKR